MPLFVGELSGEYHHKEHVNFPELTKQLK